MRQAWRRRITEGNSSVHGRLAKQRAIRPEVSEESIRVPLDEPPGEDAAEEEASLGSTSARPETNRNTVA